MPISTDPIDLAPMNDFVAEHGLPDGATCEAKIVFMLGPLLDKHVPGWRTQEPPPPEIEEPVAAVVATPTPTPSIPEELLRPPGLVGEIAEWIDCCAACSQPWLNLGAAIVFCGALMGRKFRTPSGLRTNLFAIVIGETSSGKEHSRERLRLLANEIGCEAMVGAGRVTSDAAIIRQLEDSASSVFLWDEIGYMLADMKNIRNAAMAKIAPLLMEVWDQTKNNAYKPKRYADGRQAVIDQPHLCVLGTGTPKKIIENMSVGDISSGLFPRFLIFTTAENPMPDLDRVLNSSVPTPPSILEACRFLYKLLPSPPDHLGDIERGKKVHQIVVEFSPKARAMMVGFNKYAYEQRIIKHDKGLNDMWGKAYQIAERLALIVAVGDFSGSQPSGLIEVRHTKWAIGVVKRLLADAFALLGEVAESTIERNKIRLLKIIQDNSPIGRWDLTRKTQFLDKRDRQSILEDLAEAGQIRFEARPNGLAIIHAV